METGSELHLLLADVVLVVHAAVAAFIVGGLALVLAGGALGWRWVRNPWFRWAHLAAIAVVVAQAWLGVLCPLTTLESTLRVRAGEAGYAGGFVAHWLRALLYWDAPSWVFTVAYTAFAAVVAVSWALVRPRRFGESAASARATPR